MQPSVLIVEDEVAIREMVAFALERNDLQAIHAQDAKEALERISQRLPDLILLDWMLPGTSGLELARKLRQDALTKEIPIIMLTARGEEDDRVRGLDTGVDDYILKPFSPRELVSRIRAVLRRTHGVNEALTVQLGKLTLDAAAQRVFAVEGEQRIELNVVGREYQLLYFLMTHAERVYTRGQLLDQIWGSSSDIEDRTVDVLIRRLRKTLEATQSDHYIQTVRGSGYRFSVHSV